MTEPGDTPLAPATTSLQPLASDAGYERLQESAAWNITATMMSGLLGFGVPGWLIARWTGWEWVTGLGLVLGMALALTIVWFRYGSYRP